ncbi:toxin-antitoxin system YwqK family antitoxin [Flavobacterium sp.]|uniref:toxin-antitoxin system YwqK family antitoxin n=1 Tax=Flavobacterium sp. TaxID=239 RepID=UPI003C3BD369
MVLKEHLLFKFISWLFFATVIIGCKKTTEEEVVRASSLVVPTSEIPKDTISSNDENIKLDNGIVSYNNKIFSGFVKEMYNPTQVKAVFSFLKGQQHGITTSYYLDGKLKDSRSYKAGKSYGRHYGFWENGHQKFDFIYHNDKREGLQKQWYETGSPYCFLMFKNDREDGMQQAWRLNGKPYINYEVKDGHRYGLQKSNLCYTLRDEKLQSTLEFKK